MKLKFEYSKEKTFGCLLNKEKNSNNSPAANQGIFRVCFYLCENLDEKSASQFIDQYLKVHNFNVVERLESYQNDFVLVSKRI